MNNKLNNMINNFLENADVSDEKELNKKLQEFMEQYNNGEIEYENTPLDDAYELLEKAENAKSEKEALKLAKKAYEMCPECFDAILFQVDLETDELKQMLLLNEGLKKEKERLEKEGFFDRDSIGHFYGIFETRPYIRGLNQKAFLLIENNQIKESKEVCKEIIRLNTNDNTGSRYLLMAIYAFLEEEKEALALFKTYPEDSFEMLFPLFALYLKQNNEKKAKEYLKKVNKANKEFVKLFKGTIEPDLEALFGGYYTRGGVSEVLMYVDAYAFLVDSIPNLKDYVLKNLDNKKK